MLLYYTINVSFPNLKSRGSEFVSLYFSCHGINGGMLFIGFLVSKYMAMKKELVMPLGEKQGKVFSLAKPFIHEAGDVLPTRSL